MVIGEFADKIKSRRLFHQHFMISFIIWKSFEQLFWTYGLGLCFFGKRKLAQKLMLVKLTVGGPPRYYISLWFKNIFFKAPKVFFWCIWSRLLFLSTFRRSWFCCLAFVPKKYQFVFRWPIITWSYHFFRGNMAQSSLSEVVQK